MLARLLFVVVCLLASTAAPSAARGAGLAFAQNFLTGSKQVVTFPAGDPASMAVVGPQTDTFSGMDFDPNANVLWAIDFTTQSVGTVNQTTGAYASNAALQGGCCISAFTIDPVGGTFYVAKSDEYVYSLDPTSGVTTLRAQGASPGAAISALAMDCAGRMFALASDGNPDNLFRVHLDAGPTLVASPGFTGATSLEFDNQSGILYAWFFFGIASGVSEHATIDTATAQLSQASNLPGRYRMAIRNVCSIFADDFES